MRFVSHLVYIFVISGLIYLLYNQTSKTQKLEQELAKLSKKATKYDNKTEVKKVVKVTKKDSNKSVKKEEIPKDAIVIELPKVPKVTAKVPKVVTIGGSKIEHEEDKILPLTMPKEEEPKKVAKNDSNKTKVNKELVGLENLGRVSAYLRGEYESKDEVIKKLKEVGFKIIGSINLKDGLDIIIFSNDTLKNMAKKSPFIENLRVSIDKKYKQISIQNPIYFAKAFMQDSYSEEDAKKVLQKINNAFELKASSDKLKASLLPKYQFMFGMPNYSDQIVIKSAKTSSELLSRLDNSKVVFKEQIDKDNFIVGVKLGSADKFVFDIGIKNSSLLPYTIYISQGKAKILNPKYYIAISYPMLKMSQFMKISDVPDAIEKSAKGVFK